MAITDNKNLWILGLIVVVIGIFAFTNLNTVTGQGTISDIRANSCDQDDTCEIINATVGSNLYVGANTELQKTLIALGGINAYGNIWAFGPFQAADDLIFEDEIRPDGSTCADGQILKKTGADNWDCADIPGGTLDCNTKMLNSTNGMSGATTCDSGYTVTGGGVSCPTSTIRTSNPKGETQWEGSCTSTYIAVYGRCCKLI